MDKYNKLRSQIKTGDVMLYNGNGIISGIIRWADNAYYSHAGIAYWIGDRLFTIDAWTNGVELVPMSRRMNMYKDFCVVRKADAVPMTLRTAMSNLLNRVERDEAYGYFGLIKRLAYLKCRKVFEFLFRIKALTRKDLDKHRKPVCSDVAREFMEDYGVICYSDIVMPTPEDLHRYVNTIELTVMFDKRVEEN